MCIKIYLDQTLCKPPNIGSAKPPHQDSAYWTDIDPPNQVVCWMALDDATEENACMRFIPGSHKKGLIEHKHLEDFRIDNENYDYDLEKAIPLKAGSCTFHHSLVIHRTDPNKSPNRRIGLTIGYMSAKSKFIGKNFVFDFRMGEKITDDIISNCHQCEKKCDEHTNCENQCCHILFIQCKKCNKKYNGCCSTQCSNFIQLPKDEQKRFKKLPQSLQVQ